MYKIKISEEIVIATFIALNLWICNVYAQDGNCGVPDGEITFISKQIVPGKILVNPIEIDMVRTLDIIPNSYTEDPTNSEKYFTFTYDEVNAKMIISTTDEFLNYERNQNKKELIATIMLLCQNTYQTEMVVTLEFEDVNNFKPEFTQTTYEIEIPLPLPIGIEIFSLISDRISAIDYDLYNNQITFTSDITNQPFMVNTSSVTTTMGKKYFVNIFTTAKIINIRNGIEFKIIATDSGTLEHKTTDVVVKIMAQSDDEQLIEVPIFAKLLYIGTLDFRQIEPLKIETISLLDETFIPSITFTKELSNDVYFQINQNNLDNAIEIKLVEGITENDLNGLAQISFVVRAIRPDGLSGNTAVLINIIPSGAPKESLLFEKTLYMGTIKSDMTIDHVPIKLTDATFLPDVQFLIKEDVLGWFEVIPESDPDVIEMQIKLIRPLSASELERVTLVELTILARSAGNTVLDGESNVVLGIERAEVILPAFQKQTYIGYLKRPIGPESFQLDNVLIYPHPGIIDFALSGEDTHFIKIGSVLTNGVALELADGITKDDVGERTVLSVIVIAKVTDTVIRSAVVIIHVDQEQTLPDTCSNVCDVNNECEDGIALIIGIIVLGLLFSIACIAIYVMWWKWIRPYRYMKRDSLNEPLENDFHDTGYTEPVVDAAVATNDVDIFGTSNLEIKNENASTQATSALPNLSPSLLAKSLYSVLDMDNRDAGLVLDKEDVSGSSETDDSTMPPPKERKKSIKFNEMVERIDILDDFTGKEDTAL